MNSKENRNSGKNLAHGEITDRVIAAAIQVHRELGPGFIESVYEHALAVEFSRSEIQFAQQKIVPLFYHDAHIGEHRLDFLVEDCIVVELKAVKALEDVHFAFVRSYLKATKLDHGLLLNFSTMPLTIKRVIFDQRARHNQPEPILS